MRKRSIGASDPSLREYIEVLVEGAVALRDEKFRSVERRLDDSEEARDLASREMNRRLEGMNEFRDQLRAQAALFMTSDKIELLHRGLETKVDVDLERFETKNDARLGVIESAIVAQQRLVIKTEAETELRGQIASYRRWLIGVGAGTIISLITLILRIANVV